MFLLPLMCICGLLLRGAAQERAAMWRGNDRGGRCLYTFTVPSPVEASCPQTAGPEVEGLKARLGVLEAMVSQLVGGGERNPQRAGATSQPELQEALKRAVGERNLLQGEKRRLEQEMERVQRLMEEMRRETERLKDRQCPPQTPAVPPAPSLQGSGLLRPAGGFMSHLMTRPNRQGDSSSLIDSPWQHGSPGFQELKAEVTEVPAPDSSPDATGCGELVSVGEPVVHRKADNIEGKYGVWMQDPEAVAPYAPGMIWRIDAIGADVRKLFGYEGMDQLSRGFPSKVLLLPEQVESTGATVYQGSLYYQKRRSRTIIRYDLASESVAARRDLPHAGFHGQFPYSWGGYTDIDLAVDEQGLWAVYSTNKAKGAIVISQLDPQSLEVKKSWETNIRKNSVANSFIICGRLYTVASYTATDTIINYVYDTEAGQGKVVSIPFKNKYRYNSMIDYNLAQRKLFAWDNYHMVSYDIRLGRKKAN
ncbi:myocilin isoform X1 [Takifugu flavidus]|uniref:Myocilin n=1 Tax=Takifugu flavidus TaxID=433684 RepID=A0A5C6MS59_9TELE|nr:myocilin isoform X1 [Takifugu flavidus]TWW57655.1 Myocilin Myocilin 55 kDa subunit [Takifugu flavidus]